MDEMRLQVNDIFLLINERFGKRFGEAQKSDLDELMEKMTNVSTETSKIRTSVQLTMIRLKTLEQAVKSTESAEPQNGNSTPGNYSRRQSNVSVHSTSSERKSRSGRSSKQRVLSDSNIQKKRERENKYATISGGQKSQQRPHSRSSLKSVDGKRHRESSRPASREGILEEHVVSREEPNKFAEYISATDDDVRLAENAQTSQPTIPQDAASSSEEETILNDFEDESSSLTADVHEKKRQTADKKGMMQKQSSISKMPKTLAEVFKKAKRKARLSSDSSQLSQRDDDIKDVEPEMLQTGQSGSCLAPLAPRSDLSDTSYVTTDN